jgi:isopenicillin-N epimerase
MAIAPLPFIPNLAEFKAELYHQHNIEVPCIAWNDHQMIRISIQGYNTPADVDALVHALTDLLPRYTD